MKKTLIGAIVGALVLFIWQFLSWSMLNVHGSQMQHNPNQDAILEFLGENMEEGAFFLPNVAPGTSSEDQQAFMEKSIGKPWAQISYHNEFSSNMGMNMFRGFVANLAALLLLCWMLGKIPGIDMKTALLSSVAVGLIGYLTINYIEGIWFENKTIPDLVDALVSWGLCGIWLGFWLPRD